MSSLADQIIRGGQKGGGAQFDEYGIPVPTRKDHLGYTLARILVRHPNLCINPYDDKIYDLDESSKTPIKECNASVVKLSGFDSYFAKAYRYALVFEKLRATLPMADMESVQIGDGLYFDGETKTIKTMPNRQETEDYCRKLVAAMNYFVRKDEKND